MSWLFLNNHSALNYSGQISNPEYYQNDATLLATGSVVIEVDLSIVRNAPCRLVHYEASNDWKRRFTIYLNADYSISVETQQGCASSYVCLSDIQPQSHSRVRLTYSWNAPNRLGNLSLENLDDGTICQTGFTAPIPMPLGDSKNIVHGCKTITIDKSVLNLAVSDQAEPVGPVPSICAGALVETADGFRPIENLMIGDKVVTHDHGAQPIRWIMKQNLPAIGRSSPIRLHAPFFGLNSDITVAQNQRVMIAGTETEYNFGNDAVLIEARNLVGYPGTSIQSGQLTETYYQLLFDNHECICLSGTWTDSLYIGQLADSPKTKASTGLAGVPVSILPIHQELAHPILRNYETQALLEALTA